MKGYTFLPDIATADVAFEAYGKTLADLFTQCALATEDVMVDLRTVNKEIEKMITLENTYVDKLLFEFLEELIYLKDAEQVLFNEFSINIEKKEKYKLQAICKGEKIHSETQDLRTDVKAVTLHLFKLEQLKTGFKAMIVLDI